MHQFITTPQVTSDALLVTDDHLVHQIKNVLRMSPGDQILIQDCQEDSSIRRTCTIESVTDEQVGCTVSESEKNVKKMLNFFTVPLPNRADKLELIVQKLAEIGIDQIDIWPARRSIMRELSDNKMRRLNAIAREAVEQSHGWFLPEITVTESFPDIPTDHLIVFDQVKDTTHQIVREANETVRGVVGPEGGLMDEEHERFRSQGAQFVSLGDTVLRMETASIVGGWMTANS